MSEDRRNTISEETQYDEETSVPEELTDKIHQSGIVSQDEEMKELCEKIPKIGPQDSSVLITGETGTGKELLAQAIHRAGSAGQEGLQAVNCSGFSETLIESELFGHVQGAFTGATRNRKGLFEQADEGTLFLDEISAMVKGMQSKLLRALEEHEISPVGSTETRTVDPRIISATNQDPLKMIQNNKFREDLFYRLNVVNLIIPPLRRRVQDIPLLADRFIQLYNQKFGHEVSGVTEEVHQLLMEHEWPGNVRQMKNLMEGIVLLKEEEDIERSDLPQEFIRQMSGNATVEAESLKNATQHFQKNLIESMLEETDGDKKKAAKKLGIDRSTLYRKLKLDE